MSGSVDRVRWPWFYASQLLLYALRKGSADLGLEWAVAYAPDGDMDAALRRAWEADGASLYPLLAELAICERHARTGPWRNRQNRAHRAMMRVYNSTPVGAPGRERAVEAAIRAKAPCPSWAEFQAAAAARSGA